MFEQTFIGEAGGARPWTFAVSLALQFCLLAAAVLTPLIFTYELPVTDWLEQTLLVAPPAAPPQAPAPAKTVPKPPPLARFAAVVAPAQIPDNVALLNETETLPSDFAAPNLAGIQGGITGGLQGGVLGAGAPSLFVPQMPLRVGGRVQAAKVVSRISPQYPAEALEQGIVGLVRLEAIITTQGRVRDIRVLSGDAALAGSAVEAVREWRYEPTFLNGRPVEVITAIEVKFAITAPPEPTKQDKKRSRKKSR